MHVPKTLLVSDQPIGLFLSAKAASRIYLNGQLLGENGVPAKGRNTETPGQLDTVIYVPREMLEQGNNKITLLLSGQHSIIPSSQAVLTLKFGEYLKPPHHGRPSYWLSIMTFGVFLIGAIYFGVAAKLGQGVLLSLTLSAASMLAALQLLTEVSRGLWAYAYPFHDTRLVLISMFSAGVGFLLAFHTFGRFKLKSSYAYLAALFTVTIIGLFVIPSFDGKASWVILVPSLGAGTAASLAIFRGGRSALGYAVTFFGFASLILLNPGDFLDTYYYFALMTLFICLFAQQAFALRAAIREKEVSEESRTRLKAALEAASPPKPVYILVKSSGKQEQINTNDIAVLSGAGDYVNIRLIGGREILHTGSLGALQKQLPACFLSVHRSHVINTKQVAALKRLPSGVGELRLADDFVVPVSRRIMPKMRKTLLDKG